MFGCGTTGRHKYDNTDGFRIFKVKELIIMGLSGTATFNSLFFIYKGFS